MRSVFVLGVFAALLALAGCQSPFDPYGRPGQWSSTNAANVNAATQVADKGDLIAGRSEPGSSGIAAVGGIEKATSGGTASGLQTQLTSQAPSSF